MTTTVSISYTEGEDVRHYTWSISDHALEQVRFDFNPELRTDVNLVKLTAALALDVANEVGKDGRLTALARTAYVEASMWAVKSATAEPQERP